MPSKSAGTYIQSNSFKMSARYRLNDNLIQGEIICPCGKSIDCKGTHATICKEFRL